MKDLGNKIKKVLHTDRDVFTIRLKFTDGWTGTVSLGHLFEHPRGLTAEILKGGLFDQCFVQSGALAWPNGLELCPDALRRLIKEQSLKVAA